MTKQTNDAVADAEALLDNLRFGQPGPDYGRDDRLRDFRAVFRGDSTPEQGRRVLWQVLAWCRLFRPVAAPGDPYETYRRDGERNIGLKILAVLNAKPPDSPGKNMTTDKTKGPHDG